MPSPLLLVGFTTVQTGPGETEMKPWVYICAEGPSQEQVMHIDWDSRSRDIPRQVTDRAQHIPHHVFLANIGRAARRILAQDNTLARKLHCHGRARLLNRRTKEVSMTLEVSVRTTSAEGNTVHTVDIQVEAKSKVVY